MGFRKHRRHRGGGGGGHQHHHYGFGTGEPNGVQPGDDLGNRRQLKPVYLPPDDIGNRRDPEEAEWVPEDNVGNRIEASPTHELSGVLIELDGRRRRRRPKGVSAPERVGRFLVGGVNPLIAANVPRPFPGKTLEESLGGAPPRPPFDEGRATEDDGEGASSEGRADGGRRERGRRRGGDGYGGHEVSERRTQRFFDFEEDDRFEYTLKTPAEQKRTDAERCVRDIVTQAGRDATVVARLIEDGRRPKVLVTVEERGPAATVPVERRAVSAGDPLFAMGNGALMSLNYLVNKIVNRYPDDRIRLAILPAADERLYLDSLADHRKLKPLPQAAETSAEPTPVVAPAPAAPLVVVADVAASPPAPAKESAPTPAAPVALAEAPAPTATATATDDGDEETVKAKPARRARAPRDDSADAQKRPARRPVKKTPAVEVVKAPRR